MTIKIDVPKKVSTILFNIFELNQPCRSDPAEERRNESRQGTTSKLDSFAVAILKK